VDIIVGGFNHGWFRFDTSSSPEIVVDEKEGNPVSEHMILK
jgi:hypothetical protein